jgi:hypothetical protein
VIVIHVFNNPFFDKICFLVDELLMFCDPWAFNVLILVVESSIKIQGKIGKSLTQILMLLSKTDPLA